MMFRLLGVALLGLALSTAQAVAARRSMTENDIQARSN
jgi:hypothetical protein